MQTLAALGIAVVEVVGVVGVVDVVRVVVVDVNTKTKEKLANSDGSRYSTFV